MHLYNMCMLDVDELINRIWIDIELDLFSPCLQPSLQPKAS